MINLHESYEAGLGLEFTTPGSAARPAAEQAEEANNFVRPKLFYFLVLGRAYSIVFQNLNKNKSAFTQIYFYFSLRPHFCVKNEMTQ